VTLADKINGSRLTFGVWISPKTWSPDGQKLACTVTSATWLADSRRLFITTPDGNLAIVDTQSGAPRVALSLQPDILMGRPSGDNRQIVFSRGSIEGDVYMLTFR
jgi:hypothetical protein